LLKNSAVATLRQRHSLIAQGKATPTSPLPPVKVIVAVSDEAVQLKLVDEAGGIRRSSLTNVWSYRSLDSAWWKPIDGLSLPMARLYAQYLGGTLDLVPLEGWGSDCYVTFNKPPHANVEQILPTDLLTDDHAPSSDGLLLDAQARRGSR